MKSPDIEFPDELTEFMIRRRRGGKISDQAATDAGLDGLVKALEKRKITNSTPTARLWAIFNSRALDERRRHVRLRRILTNVEPPNDPADDARRVDELVSAALRAWMMQYSNDTFIANKLEHVSVAKLVVLTQRSRHQISCEMTESLDRLSQGVNDLLSFIEKYLNRQGVTLHLTLAVLDRAANIIALR